MRDDLSHKDRLTALTREYNPAKESDPQVSAMNFMTADAARHFAQRWLPAWTGNNPEGLAEFYSDDTFYLDPGVPEGIRGKKELLEYFRRLLKHNPNWVWTQLETIPTEDGFLNKWRADIPVGDDTISIVGVCFVQLNADEKIKRNEVYFDRSELLAKISAHRAG